jgi:hypothetical protein
MTVVLFDDEAGREPDQGGVVGEDANYVGAAADLAVEPFERIRIQYERGRRLADRPPLGG